MAALKRLRNEAFFSEPSRTSRMTEYFGIPSFEQVLIEVMAVFQLVVGPSKGGRQGEAASGVFAGKVYLSTSFICFASLDRRSCKLSLPFATVKRVEKVGQRGRDGNSSPVVSVFCLAIELYDGHRFHLQLNALRSTCDQFTALFTQHLKAAKPLMKSMPIIAKTCFSDALIHDKLPGDLVGAESATTKGDISTEKNDTASAEFTTISGIDQGWHSGQGQLYKYPGDPKRLRERYKTRLWREYLQENGHSFTTIRFPYFARLVLAGLPNRLRGEIWELTSGSLHLRAANPGEYERLLINNKGKTSLSTEEIEKDLNRSMPEYPAYQTEEGRNALRRVLTAYAWKNPDLGYCQAMNIVVAALLMQVVSDVSRCTKSHSYTSEEQCFWLLNVLCDRLLPGYYSPTMYGTLLDQKVFEHLVQRCLPHIMDHFRQHDIQLSVASLPWFLSLFLSSMPLVFAFRIVDCFCLLGPKVLFQVSLAILKLNGEALLEATDDGAFISIMKAYFASLGDSAYPNSPDPKQRQIDKFRELLSTALLEFGSIITDDTVANERKKFRAEVIDSIEAFAKRAAIRNLNVGRLKSAQTSAIYDTFQTALLKAKEASISSNVPRASALIGASFVDEENRPEIRIDRVTFGFFIGDIATWARDETVVKNSFHEHVIRKVAEHELIDRLFYFWDASQRGALSLQDVTNGLNSVLYNDLMTNIAWFFTLHDHDRDGHLTKDEVLQLSESLLFIFRNELGDQYLAAVSRLLQNAFEYAETMEHSPVVSHSSDMFGGATETTARPRTLSINENPNRPYISLATFRMVVLADELLETFFDSDFTASWRLEMPVEEAPARTGLLGGLLNVFATDENIERLNYLADVVGKRLDIQTIEQKPSIGKADPRAELKSRESPFNQTRRPSASPVIDMSPLSAASMRSPVIVQGNATSSSPADANVPTASTSRPAAKRSTSILPERDVFLIDQAIEEEQSPFDANAHDGENLMDELDAFLRSNDAMTPADETKTHDFMSNSPNAVAFDNS